MKREKEYKRMAGMRLFFSRASLWLGQDHVLVVKSQGYSEVYTRFYFNDIQGFLMYKTVTGKVLNIVWGLFAALFAGYCLEGILVWQSDFASYANGFLGGVFLLLLIIDLAKGPTCRCYLRTAVHTEIIKALPRLRRAVKTVRLLIPTIEQHQGALSQEFPLTIPGAAAYGRTPVEHQ